MKIISSYPRSGQAKLRFLIANILYPDIEHNFETIRLYTPSIDSEEQRTKALDTRYVFTHSNINCDVYLYRHVGDVLISEFWYKKKYGFSDGDPLGFILSSKYGQDWRRSIEFGRSAPVRISFEDLFQADILAKKLGFTLTEVEEAMKRCSFNQMREAETKTDTVGGDKSIPYMREGTSGQWQTLPPKVQYSLIQNNEGELVYLSYWSMDAWSHFLQRHKDKL